MGSEMCIRDRYILGEVVINGAKFDPITQTNEKWGVIEDGYAIIYNNAFDAMCKKGGFSKKAFLSWADKKGLLQTQGGQLTKVKKSSGNPVRCVFLKVDETVDNEGFQVIDETQEALPFR